MYEGHAGGERPGETLAERPDPAVSAALSTIGAGIDALIELGDRGRLAGLPPGTLASVVSEVEQVRNRLAAVDHLVVEAVQRTALWEATQARDAAGVIAQIARVPRAEAKARVRAAELLGPRTALDGARLPATLQRTASAQRSGEVSPGQAAVIGQCVRELDLAVGMGDATRDAEESLVQFSAALDLRELRAVAHRIVDVVVPDGRPPRDELVRARRGIFLGAERSDGSCPIGGTLTKALRAKLFAVLSPLAAPRPVVDGVLDERSAAQRLHDGLEDACDRLLRSGDLPSASGSPATVMVVAQLDDLLERIERDAPFSGFGSAVEGGSFRTADGRVLSVSELLRVADSAQLIPVFMSNRDGIVAYGRSRRLASAGQWRALTARDRGCSFPGCDTPPQWCQVHHVVPWAAGGATDLDNLTLVCGYHHREFENRGWACRMVGGLPYWIPPSWVDRRRRPLQNSSHSAAPVTDRRLLDGLNAAHQAAQQDAPPGGVPPAWQEQPHQALQDPRPHPPQPAHAPPQESSDAVPQEQPHRGPPAPVGASPGDRTATLVARLVNRDLERAVDGWLEDAIGRRLADVSWPSPRTDEPRETADV